VTTAQSGEYRVLVSNGAGAVLSQPATLTVTTQMRQLILGAVAGSPNTSVTVPVGLRAQGDENEILFSAGYDNGKLKFSSLTPGANATGASIRIDVNQLEAGRFGVHLSLPEGQSFRAGQQELVLLEFEIVDREPGSAALMFLDAPIAREIRSVSG